MFKGISSFHPIPSSTWHFPAILVFQEKMYSPPQTRHEPEKMKVSFQLNNFDVHFSISGNVYTIIYIYTPSNTYISHASQRSPQESNTPAMNLRTLRGWNDLRVLFRATHPFSGTCRKPSRLGKFRGHNACGGGRSVGGESFLALWGMAGRKSEDFLFESLNVWRKDITCRRLKLKLRLWFIFLHGVKWFDDCGNEVDL